MSIDSIGSSTSLTATPWLAQTAPTSSPPAADGDAGTSTPRAHHRGHHGGGGAKSIEQAMQALGVGVPAAATASAYASGDGTDGTDGTDSAGTSSAIDGLRQDLHAFMHSLFDAVRTTDNASTGSGDATGGGANAGGSGFAAGLSALVTQVSAGNAPSDLQSAFNKLLADQPGAAGASASDGSGSSSVTLQALLTQLQQNLGYGSTGVANGVGNVVSASA